MVIKRTISKEEIKEFWITLADEIIPGHSNDQKEQDSRQVEQAQKEARPPRKQDVPKENAQGKDDGNQPLRQHAKAHGSIEKEQILLLFCPFEDIERGQARVDKERQGHIENANRRND